MFQQAVDVVIDAGQASTSLLQRRCKLGYARAARIMDLLPPAGESATQPGRNDPCPCGSGLKFKHCCMGKLPYV